MTSYTHFKKIAVVIGAGSALASCTLPPEQAWRKIKTEGLVAYWSYELGSQHAYSHLKYHTPGTPATTIPAPMMARPRVSPLNDAGMLNTGRTLTAMSIPALPGFVRSPYTNPPRLVDVKGATPGSTMICPYSQRPFVIPSDFSNAPGPMIVDAPPSGPSIATTGPAAPAPKKTSEPLPKVTINERPIQPAPTPAPSQPKPQPQAQPQPKSKPTPAPSNVASTKPTAPLTAPTTPPAVEPKKPMQEIPFGESIAGRPGFVNSPFAAKHQLVDVTGLPTGMEVKCPYTGKLFRVPPQDMVSSKPVEAPPLASPNEQPKKK